MLMISSSLKYALIGDQRSCFGICGHQIKIYIMKILIIAIVIISIVIFIYNKIRTKKADGLWERDQKQKEEDDNQQKNYRLETENSELIELIQKFRLEQFNCKIECAPFYNGGSFLKKESFGKKGYWRGSVPFCVFVSLSENNFKKFIEDFQPETLCVIRPKTNWDSGEQIWGRIYIKLSDFIFLSMFEDLVLEDSTSCGLLDKLGNYKSEETELDEDRCFYYKKQF